MKPEISKKRGVFDHLKKYCYFAKEDDCIEITEWINGEGYDISITRSEGDKFIQLTHGELDAIKYLIDVLNYESDKPES